MYGEPWTRLSKITEDYLIEDTPPQYGSSQGKETVTDATDTRPTRILRSTSLSNSEGSFMWPSNFTILVPRRHSDPQNFVPGGHKDP